MKIKSLWLRVCSLIPTSTQSGKGEVNGAQSKHLQISSYINLGHGLSQRRSSRPPNPPIGGGPRPTLGAQVSLKLLFGYVTIFSSADLFTTDLNCRKKLACDIISECNVILSRRI